jgi:integrase/recombinase XerD
MKKKPIKMTAEAPSINDVFPRFVSAKIAEGVSEKTAKMYRQHLHCISKHLDLSIPLAELTQDDINNLIVSMRRSGLAHNSISSYARVLRTLLKWCQEQGYSNVYVPPIKDRETVKETYTDGELSALLRKPDKNCDFSEYRNWVIINFLLNCGCRAGTIRNIQNRDIDLSAKQVAFRHTKAGKVQIIPLCSLMVLILREYMAIRKGKPEDYLFCDQYGGMLSENALRLAIAKYNRRRGVSKTSIHQFRHTFARKYLVDCGGDAFTLQRLMGHSTLKMTKHYCSIYDADISKNYDKVSPLAQIQKPRETIRM